MFDENNQPYISANLTQIIVVNGVSGYVWDETTLLFTKITSVTFTLLRLFKYQDGYLIFGRQGTGQFFISNVDDALTYDAINPLMRRCCVATLFKRLSLILVMFGCLALVPLNAD